ncbi:CBS domain-containing protein [Lentilactobacillus parabuchneri]|uniref:CBS domain-containing protein n=1 Tax=Lentilactobacillus parabuchneri TaxID=152331 RepID=UPI000A1195DF|nr:helix-turn-helix transcriptional regulator [Lentilactobacillus parabuchneri]ORN32591.1 Transcriptional repressor CcpN [Lentilactobacillus parabuchneri]ORN32973.1 Transcriptional repressor CcpN [Lentilactobacillus parabuchneri]ORN36748.1 Transcriptional repressor CcpN [Lentilactobacillus parabuchneri]
MKLTPRQNQIIAIVKKDSPITSKQISAELKLSMPTIRSDLRLLTAFGILEAKPKVGYTFNDSPAKSLSYQKFYQEPIRSILQKPTEIREDATLTEAVNTLFIEDVGSLYVVGDQNELVGLISRKDLLRATLNNTNASLTLASTVMTRMPNIFTVTPDMSVIETGKLLLERKVDSLPVVDQDNQTKVVGKITKNRIFQHFIESVQ